MMAAAADDESRSAVTVYASFATSSRSVGEVPLSAALEADLGELGAIAEHHLFGSFVVLDEPRVTELREVFVIERHPMLLDRRLWNVVGRNVVFPGGEPFGDVGHRGSSFVAEIIEDVPPPGIGEGGQDLVGPLPAGRRDGGRVLSPVSATVLVGHVLPYIRGDTNGLG